MITIPLTLKKLSAVSLIKIHEVLTVGHHKALRQDKQPKDLRDKSFGRTTAVFNLDGETRFVFVRTKVNLARVKYLVRP